MIIEIKNYIKEVKVMKKLSILLLALAFLKIYSQNFKVELMMEIPHNSGVSVATTPIGKTLFCIPNNAIQTLDTNLYLYVENKTRIYGIKNYFPIWGFGLTKWITENVFYIYTLDSLYNISEYLINIDEVGKEARVIKKLPRGSYYTYWGLYPPLNILVKWNPVDSSWGIYKYILDSSFNAIIVDTIGEKITHQIKNGWWPPQFLSETKYWCFFLIVNINYEIGSILVGVSKTLNRIVPITFIPSSPHIYNYSGRWELDNPPHKEFKIFYLNDEVDNFELIYYGEIKDTCDVFPLGSIINYNFYAFRNNKGLWIESLDRFSGERKILFYKKNLDQFGFLITFQYFYLNDKVYFIIGRQGENPWSWIFKIEIDSSFTNVENIRNVSNFNLYQNYPNPFNPSTTIEFDIPERTNVKLVVYDILGREVETLIDKELEPGKYKLNFTSTNLPSGVYFYTLRTPKFTKTNKMLLIK
jgi:hypothetical protein